MTMNLILNVWLLFYNPQILVKQVNTEEVY